ncbi:MAG: hypothetical protein M3463_05770 [Verrucomicrobiota bacterium]|nr:hypothetical protein [Verrucomicrobiota bacterium]
MLLTAYELNENQPSEAWFCLRAQPKREHVGAAGLRQIPGLDVFCPRLRFRKQTVRGAVWFVEPMFPGYLFARFEYRVLHRQVRAVPGVTGLVHFGERVALVPDLLLAEIRSRTGDDEVVQIDQGLEPGQAVEIVHGPLRSMKAIVTRVFPARERVQILLEWMGRELHAEAAFGDLLPATKPPPPFLAREGKAE